MSTLRTNAILDSAGGNTATINGIPLRQGVLDPENRIINGAFDFWQRGTSFTAIGYGADRWINEAVDGTVTMSQQPFTLGDTLGSNSPTYFLRQTASGQTLATARAAVHQRIESVRSYAGQTITVLGWARRSSGSGNMAVEGTQYFGSGGSPSAGVTGIGVTTVTLTGSWAPFAVTMAVPSIAGKTLGSNNNDAFWLFFWTSAGSNLNARTNSLGLQTIGVDLWGIHIKLGTHTTAAVDLYKQPELGPELARCQRYYEKSYNVDVNPATNTTVGAVALGGSSSANGAMNVPIFFKVRKRGTPVVSFFESGGASGTWVYARATGGGSVSMSAAYASTTGFLAQTGSIGAAWVVAVNEGHWVADAEL